MATVFKVVKINSLFLQNDIGNEKFALRNKHIKIPAKTFNTLFVKLIVFIAVNINLHGCKKETMSNGEF